MRAIQSDLQRANPISCDLVYLIIDVIVVLLTALAAWSLVRLIRRRRPLDRRFSSILSRLIAPLVWELVIPLGILLGFPALQGGSWSVILLYLPDLGSWALAIRSFSLPSGAPSRDVESSHRDVLPMS